MKYKRHVYDRISNEFLLFTLATLFFLKIIIYSLVKSEVISFSLGGGSDAYYYDAYAQRSINIALNIWPVILRYLNDVNLYSRDFVSYIFLLLNMLVIPITVAKLAGIKISVNQKYYFYIVLICLLYPTLYFFTFDIYRDVFMVLCFLIGCVVVKAALTTKSSLIFISLFIVSIIIGWFLAALRPYLGVAFIGALFLWSIRFTKRKIVFLSILYLLILFIANYIGVLEPLTEYRSGFEESEGGSTLGLSFSNPILFIPNFILSFLGQMLGLYVTNPLALVLLLIETAPFFFMLIYVIKNIKWADKFVRFLIIFFVLYASVWLIGNDNLGTAVRLRMYNYFAIYISFFYILKLKNLSLKRLQVVSS
ncbi:hypothetical protein ACQKDP_07205 [Psychrobacter pacificensis]|uniref:hypothetical protein n=1 Tax=Psychrobacter pacificensis TaxID=112002 RepID=UPI003D061A7E